MPDNPDPVSAAFARASEALASSPAAAGVTVTTADLATALCPWSLAWAKFGGSHQLFICRHTFHSRVSDLWSNADPEARLATLRQLPELLTRVAAASVKAERAAEPGEVEYWAGQVIGAIGTLRGGVAGGEREGRD